jgi:hypothetical protein
LWLSEIDTRDHTITYLLDDTDTLEAQTAVAEDGETVFYLKTGPDGSDLVGASLVVK